MTIHVNLSEDGLAVTGYFASAQDPAVWPGYAEIEDDDPRYAAWYYAKPESMRDGLPVPAGGQ
jgi:hypothetical protein